MTQNTSKAMEKNYRIEVVSINADGSWDSQREEEFDTLAEAQEAYNNTPLGMEVDKMLVDVAGNRVLMATDDRLI